MTDVACIVTVTAMITPWWCDDYYDIGDAVGKYRGQKKDNRGQKKDSRKKESRRE